jgi:hypothetical protein
MNSVASHWLLFGHLVGLAVLGAGLGGYIAGLHRLAGADTLERLRSAAPTLQWGERIALVGYGLLVATGIGLGIRVSAFDDAWLLTSLALLVVIAAAGRFSGVALRRLYDSLPASGELAPAGLAPVLRASRALAIHLPADATVVGIVELVYLMTLRPGGAGIAVSLAVAALVVTGAAIALSRPVPAAEGAR